MGEVTVPLAAGWAAAAPGSAVAVSLVGLLGRSAAGGWWPPAAAWAPVPLAPDVVGERTGMAAGSGNSVGEDAGDEAEEGRSWW